MWPDAGRPQLGTPGSMVPGQGEGKEGQRAPGPAQCPLSLHLLPPPLCRCWKLALKWRNWTCPSPGQGLLLCSRGTQCLAEPRSQEPGTPSHPSSQSRLVRRKRALMGVSSGGRTGEALVPREAEPPPAAQLLAPKLGQNSSSLSTLGGAACFPSVRFAGRCIHTHAHTHTPRVQKPTQGRRAGTPPGFTVPSRAGPPSPTPTLTVLFGKG